MSAREKSGKSGGESGGTTENNVFTAYIRHITFSVRIFLPLRSSIGLSKLAKVTYCRHVSVQKYDSERTSVSILYVPSPMNAYKHYCKSK